MKQTPATSRPSPPRRDARTADPGGTSAEVIRCISIDVEEYFQIEAAHAAVGHGRWGDWPSRVQRNMDLLLDLFDRTGCRATFFFLGSVAKRHHGLARRCVELGHEVASHGSMHDRLNRLTPQTMLRDVADSKQLLEDQTGKPVLGYRAPTWSLTRQTSWAVDVLAGAGFKYDASVFPVRHPMYGVPDAPDRPYFVRGDVNGAQLLELPPLTWRIAGRNLAVAGGGYFRLLPLSLMLQGLKQAETEKRPAILYFHPWEFDPDMPRMPLSATGRLRTYTGLKSAAARLEKVIRAFNRPVNPGVTAASPPLPPGEGRGEGLRHVASDHQGKRNQSGPHPNPLPGGEGTGQGGGWRTIGEQLDVLSAMADQTGVFTLRAQAAA